MHCSRKKHHQENRRIGKLLSSEYHEFSERILVESPFAETSRNGRGIRQVTLGLTPRSLIVAGDILTRDSAFFCPHDLDPSIESFELISIYPLEYVSLSVFRRRCQKTLKARFIDGRVRYYEFGPGRQTKSWKSWCQLLEKLLARRMDGSSLSESTAASSSSTSTIYFRSSEYKFSEFKGQRPRRMLRVWNHYAGTRACSTPSWTERNLYLGPSYEELFDSHYTPDQMKLTDCSLQQIQDELTNQPPSNESDAKVSHSWPFCEGMKISRNHCLCNVLFSTDWEYNQCEYCSFPHVSPTLFLNRPKESDNPIEKRTLSRKVSRFGIGVSEKCNSSLVLGPCRRDSSYRDILRFRAANDFHTLVESTLSLWERNARNREKSRGHRRHFRRYALATAAHFHRALGPWSIQPGERCCIRSHRAMSLVTIRKQACEAELKLPVSRRQLTTSASCTSLQPDCSIGSNNGGKVILFWTPDYWYRPRHAIDAYRQLRRHLDRLREFRQQREHRSTRKLFNGRNKCPQAGAKKSETSTGVEERASGSLLGRLFAKNEKKGRKDENETNGTIEHLRRVLRMDLRITIWDLDSTILARQLTLIDRDLFTRIPAEEVRVLAQRKTCASAPNLGAWIAFAHRVSCLVGSEILAIRDLEMRTRIIARLVNAATKCFIMGNFQSCRSILAGLQAPPIYRLRSTWSHLRTHHATRYEMMERYSKIFKNTRAKAYQRAWTAAERKPPYLPYVGDVLTRVSEFPDQEPARYLDHPPNQPQEQADLTKKESQARLKKQKISPPKNPYPRTQSLGKRILKMTLRRTIPFRPKSKVPDEPIEARSLQLREDDLARKYFHRWHNILLRSRMRAREEEQSRTMDPRTKHLLDVATWLIDCQRISLGYDFSLHSIAQEFLLKARYREDRENFLISLKLEAEPFRVT